MIVYAKYMILKLFNLQTSPSITKPSSNITNITKHSSLSQSDWFAIWRAVHFWFLSQVSWWRVVPSDVPQVMVAARPSWSWGPGVKVWGPGCHRLWECFVRGLIPSWLVVWNIVYFSIYIYTYIGKNYPNLNIFQRGWNHQPALVFWVP